MNLSILRIAAVANAVAGTSAGLAGAWSRVARIPWIGRGATLFILVVLIAGASVASPDFLTAPNAANVARQVVGVGIMSMGMLLVVLTGGIDLSVGSVAALSSVVAALLLPGQGLVLAMASGLAVGAACGLVNGALIAIGRLSAFVVTLAMMTIARGAALIASNGAPILVGDEGQALLDFGRGAWWHLPQTTLLMLAVFACGAVFLGLTRAGRIVRAIGSNEEAVRLSGVPVARHVMLAYAVCGALAGMAGMVSTARAGVGAPASGVGDELTVIAAVVIGGASLAGGRGTVLNTLVGVLILGVISNIMNLTSVPGYHQQVVMGLIILVAIVVQRGAGAGPR
ncbi:ABC transporter permease [Delftia sp. PS-11]|uniref:ABC transporter permease n=1 Tax=Delftia sp. PS-11 TaxID=2767222 RepID=UPI002458E042|nr:ABC transporter permease [Delftia sp. PS-11]KAJ8743516.1 ABC transporter permease [Delftia sp. PS-11]